MLFGKKPFKVQTLATLSASQLPWRSEGVLVFVERGLGVVRWTSGKQANISQRSLVVGNTSLLIEQAADEYWCPTCENLLALGAGRENVDAKTLEALRGASNPSDAPLATTMEALTPLLELLEDGVYLVSRIPHHPTNGEGQPFWALSRRLQPMSASRNDVRVITFRYAAALPTFLLPTQSFDRCDWSRVEAYREAIRSGQRLGGLAFWVDGFLSGLLDGHHRATASLLEGVPLSCLTVTQHTGYQLRESGKSLEVWGQSIPFHSLPDEVVRALEATPKAESVAQPAQGEAPRYEGPHWEAMTHAAKKHPTLRGVAALQLAGDTSDVTVESLGAGIEAGTDNAWLVMQAWIAANDLRAVPLALRIARGPAVDAREALA